MPDWTFALPVSYKVYRSTTSGFTPGSGNLIDTVTASRYVDDDVPAAGVYYYKIVAVTTAGGSSAATAQVIADTTVTPTTPAAPSGLTFSNVTSTSITISWTDNSLNELGFTVRRSSDGGATWEEEFEVGTNATSFTDTGLTANASYTYVLLARNGGPTTSSTSPSTQPTTDGSDEEEKVPEAHDGIPDNRGGLDDGDGNQTLTDRDNFWVNNPAHDILIIGFAGHTQSLGYDAHKGRMWNVDPDTGTYEIGQRIKNEKGWAVTLFPEDPGNFKPVAPGDPEGDDLCGDGVLGAENPLRDDRREDALGRKTGALEFLIDAIKMPNGPTKIGLFGYSNGAGCVQILIDALARRARNDDALKNKLLGNGGQAPVNFFWTAYIDAVYVALEGALIGDGLDAVGRHVPVSKFPIENIEDGVGDHSFGTQWHFNIYQDKNGPAGQPDDDLPLALGGKFLDEAEWGEDGWNRNPARLRQIGTDEAGSRWLPRGLDHTDKADHGIAENKNADPEARGVQEELLLSLDNAAQVAGIF